jgi:hypothetical protein
MNRASALAFLAGAALFGLASGESMALDRRYPDWPCQQLKVPTIAMASIWSGPVFEATSSRSDDPKMSDLVAQLAARRTPMDEARRLIQDYVVGGAEERQGKAKALFAALFDLLNTQRDQVMTGIERFSRKEKALASDIRANVDKLRDLQDSGQADAATIDSLSKGIEWETRIFEDRAKSTTYVCEVPTLIEKRLFDLGKAIQQAAK